MKKNDLKVFDNLYDLYRYLGLPIDLIDTNTDFTIFNLKDLNRSLPLISPVFRLNFFVFIFVKNGIGKYTIDDHVYDLQPGSIYFTNPGHSRSFTWTETQDVMLITLSEGFLKENVHSDIFEEFPFLLSETIPGRVVSKDIFEEFEPLYHQIQKEYLACSQFRKRLIGKLFVVLLLKIKEYFCTEFNASSEGDRGSQIVRNFKRSLEKHYRDLNKGLVDVPFRLHDYAEKQNFHPNYLSYVIKCKTGKSIGRWIAEKTIVEAKSLLQNSNLSIKEISYKLGYSEIAHFTNFFKKHTEMSPALYRKQISPYHAWVQDLSSKEP